MRPLASRCLMLAASTALLGCSSDNPTAPSPMPGGPLAAKGVGSVLAPSNAAAVAISDTRIRLTWQDNSTNESRFEIYRASGGETGTFAVVGWVAANVMVFDDQGLQGATPYCYRVRAVRLVGAVTSNSALSNTACATTLAPPPPLPNPATMWRVYALDSSTVRVEWRDASWNEDGFRVYRSLDGGATWVLAATVSADVFVDTGVPNAESGICYRVVAFNSTGDAAPSPTSCTTPPAAPSNVTVTAIDDSTLEIGWRDNSAVEDVYQVWAETGWTPVCTSICDAVVYTYDWMVAELPANSTSYRCTTCAGAAVWIVAKKGGFEASSEWAWP